MVPGRLLTAVVLATFASACTIGAAADTLPSAGPHPSSSPTPAPVQLKIALLEDLSPDEAVAEILPALHAAEIALANASNAGDLGASVELVPVDTAADPASATAQIVDDPSFVGAIIAPFFQDQATIASALDRAGVATLSLSSRGTHVSTLGLEQWRRLVASRPFEASAFASLVDAMPRSRDGVCLIDGAGPDRSAWRGLVRSALAAPIPLEMPALDPSDDPASAVTRVAEAGCGVVIWSGSAEAAAAFRAAMVEHGLRRVTLAGSDQLKQDAYLVDAGPAADRTIATCSCVDLSTSTRLAAQRFIQDYQSEEGVPPGPYAAEAWDGARMFVHAIKSARTLDRAAIGSALFSDSTYEGGLAGPYGFLPDGELADAPAHIHSYRVEGRRWIALGTR